MEKYKTICGKVIYGYIVNDKYKNIVIICDQMGVSYVVLKKDLVI